MKTVLLVMASFVKSYVTLQTTRTLQALLARVCIKIAVIATIIRLGLTLYSNSAKLTAFVELLACFATILLVIVVFTVIKELVIIL